jgi:hypothetical protein
MTVPQKVSDRKLPAGLAETSPLVIGLVGISAAATVIRLAMDLSSFFAGTGGSVP